MSILKYLLAFCVLYNTNISTNNINSINQDQILTINLDKKEYKLNDTIKIEIINSSDIDFDIHIGIDVLIEGRWRSIISDIYCPFTKRVTLIPIKKETDKLIKYIMDSELKKSFNKIDKELLRFKIGIILTNNINETNNDVKLSNQRKEMINERFYSDSFVLTK